MAVTRGYLRLPADLLIDRSGHDRPRPETRPDVAGRGLTCRSAAVIMAGRGLPQPHACGRWLPVWLPGISLAALMFEWQNPGVASSMCRSRQSVTRYVRQASADNGPRRPRDAPETDEPNAMGFRCLTGCG